VAKGWSRIRTGKTLIGKANTRLDGKATPKIIGFGVATALTQRFTANTIFKPGTAPGGASHRKKAQLGT
jgi:hypothetical protein